MTKKKCPEFIRDSGMRFSMFSVQIKVINQGDGRNMVKKILIIKSNYSKNIISFFASNQNYILQSKKSRFEDEKCF